MLSSGDGNDTVELISTLMSFRQWIRVCEHDWAAFVVDLSITGSLILSQQRDGADVPDGSAKSAPGREHVPAGLCREPDWPCWW